MPRRYLNSGVNVVGGISLGLVTMVIKAGFDYGMSVNSRFLFSTLCIAVASFFFGRTGGIASAVTNVLGQIIFYKYVKHHINAPVDGATVLITFAITAALMVFVIDRAMTLHRQSVALIHSLRNERAQSIEYRTLLEGAVDAVAEPLAIFEPVKDDKGQPIDFALRFSNSTRPYNVAETLPLKRQLVGRQLSALLPEMCRAELLEQLLDVLKTGVPLNTVAMFPDDQYGTATYDVAAKRVGETVVVQWRSQRRLAASA